MTSPRSAQWRRAALIVFHGIGEQDPYQPLDAFARGLRAVLRLPEGRMQHLLSWRDDHAMTAVRLQLDDPAQPGARQLDISEFYWAPMVEGQIGIWQVLTWLFKTGVQPLFRWADQPALLRPEEMTGAQQAWVFVKTLARSVFLMALAFGVIAPFILVALNYRDIATDVKDAIWPSLRALLTTPAFLGGVVLLVISVCMLIGFWELLRGSDDAKRALSKTESRFWTLASAVLGLSTGLVAALLLSSPGVRTLIGTLITGFLDSGLALPAAISAVTALFTWPLVKVVGDVPLYVTQNERSAYYKTRQEILEASAKRVKSLLVDDQYQAVYVAGHSLGSVIGYDTINCLAREVRSLPQARSSSKNGPASDSDSSPLTREQFEKLRGLLTFGSPLDKVYYFFRTRIKDDEDVRAQLQSSLHGFRRESSGRTYGDCTIVYHVPEPREFTWLNVHSRMDPVGAHLDYFKVDGDQPCLLYLNPITAHTKYWNDHERFYPEVAHWLGLAAATPSDSTLVTWIKKIPRISRKSLQMLRRVSDES